LHYEWAVSNSGNGTARRLETVYFEIGNATSSNGSVGTPTWASTNSIVSGWNAIQFDYVSGTRIGGGAVQTFAYDLDSYINHVHIRTVTRDGAIEDFFIEDLDFGCLLPVELADFRAVRSDGKVLFEWSTFTETNASHFELQGRVSDEFRTIQTIQADGSPTAAKKYSYEYPDLQGLGAQFRMKIIDLDGTISYSSVIEIDPDYSRGSLIVGDIYPNPASENVRFEVSAATPGNISIDVFDMLGRNVNAVDNRTAHYASNSQFVTSISTNHIPAGLYFVRVSNANSSVTRKFVVGR
jgi:hypothetical protein